MLLMIDGKPPWYYIFYFGTIWSFIILALIIAGFLVFFVIRTKKNKNRGIILLGRLGLSVALFCLLGYAFYFLYLIMN